MDDFPSTREIQLETLIRSKDEQLSQLNHEVQRLRQQCGQQCPSLTDPVTLPPALLAVLTPYLEQASALKPGKPSAASQSNSVTSALIERVKLLQEENDELYAILKDGEVGRLKEEVNGLRRVVRGLEDALRESHDAIHTLTSELDKTYDTFYRCNKLKPPPAQSPRESYHHHQSSPTSPNNSAINGTTGSSLKPLPTGPRAFKKARTSEPRPGSSSSSSQLPTSPSAPSRKLSPTGDGRDRVKMEVDEESRRSPYPPSQSHYNDNDRGRDARDGRETRDRERDRNREHGGGRKERDKFASSSSSSPRKNGGHAHGKSTSSSNASARHSSRRKDRGSAPSHSGTAQAKVDRTLAERMGVAR